jgi:hypothetical protein
VFAKILKDAKEAKVGKSRKFTATDLKKLNLEMVQKLAEAGYTEQQIRNVIFGYAFDNKIVADNELEYDNGIFSYEGFGTLNGIDIVRDGIINASTDLIEDPNFTKYRVNHICLNVDWFYKFWEQEEEGNQNFVYKISELSFSFFIGNLMDFLAGQSVIDNSNLWFPVDKSIEVRGTF